MNDQSSENKFSLSLSGIILVALLSALNVGINLLVSPALKLLLGHIIAGMMIMVPLDLLFVGLAKYLVDKHWTSTFFMTIFGILAIPTAMFGAVAGPYKILIGFIIGLFLDIAFLPKNKIFKIITAGIFGSILWWISLFSIWQLFQLPFVTGFSTMLMGGHANFAGFVDLSNIVSLPIQGFSGDFFLFGLLVGSISAIPCMIGIAAGYGLFKAVSKTAVYEKFQSMQ